MLAGNLIVLAAVAIATLFVSQTEAGKRKHKHHSGHRGWRKLIHDRCEADDQAVIAVGIEKLDKNTISNTTRFNANMNKLGPITYVLNGKEFSDPDHRHHMKRNADWAQSIAKGNSFAVLPYKPLKADQKLSKIIKSYKRSAKAFVGAINVQPVVAYVPTQFLRKKVVKGLTKSGFVVMGNITLGASISKALKQRSFLAILKADRRAVYRAFEKAKGSIFTPVKLSTCYGIKPYVAGNAA